MFNPLDEKIKLLLQEIAQLEVERDKIVEQLVTLGAYPLSKLRPEVFEKLQPQIESSERLNRKIDSKRQELVSLELAKLNESVVSLQSTTSQVDGSVKSLQTTSEKMLKSSNKLEWLTTLLIYATLLLALIAVFNIIIVQFPSNQFYGLIEVLLTIATLGFLYLRVFRLVKKGQSK